MRLLSDARRVLVVEDDLDSADLTTFLLEERGHETRVAHTAASALLIAAEFRPHVAFLDIGLPDMDGLGLARAMRQKPELAKCKLVALSGHEAPAGGCAPFDEYLTKPIEIDDILRAVAESRTEGKPAATG